MPLEPHERPPLPSDFISPLKALVGRPKELLANRMVIQMNYFSRADPRWLDEIVLVPMSREGEESLRLWEAFAKYGRVPPNDVWERLESFLFRHLSLSQLSPEAKRQLAQMSSIVWIRSKLGIADFKMNPATFRSALTLANDDVRAAVAGQVAATLRALPDRTQEPTALWESIGPVFFEELWPLEPTLQSAATARQFAGIPANSGPCFGHAVRTILPYLQGFEVWSVMTEFKLDHRREDVQSLVKEFPEETLVLLFACISDRQKHRVHDLGAVLNLISSAKPELTTDFRMRSLRRMA